MSSFARFLLLLFLLFTGWLAGLAWFVDQMPVTSSLPEDKGSIKAIIVLTGGSKRIDRGLELLEQAPNAELLISGVGKDTDRKQLEKYNSALLNNDDDRVALGYLATDTHSNAMESLAWMGFNGYEEAVLVTSNYHVPRALYEFSIIMPEKRFITHPVFPDSITQDSWWLEPGTTLLFISEYNKYLLACIRFYFLGY